MNVPHHQYNKDIDGEMPTPAEWDPMHNLGQGTGRFTGSISMKGTNRNILNRIIEFVHPIHFLAKFRTRDEGNVQVTFHYISFGETWTIYDFALPVLPQNVFSITHKDNNPGAPPDAWIETLPVGDSYVLVPGEQYRVYIYQLHWEQFGIQVQNYRHNREH